MCANTSSSLLMKTMWHTETETAIRPGSRQAAARPPGRICYTSQQQSPLKTGTDGRYRIKPCWRGAASDAEVSPGRWREGEAGERWRSDGGHAASQRCLWSGVWRLLLSPPLPSLISITRLPGSTHSSIPIGPRRVSAQRDSTHPAPSVETNYPAITEMCEKGQKHRWEREVMGVENNSIFLCSGDTEVNP